MSDNDVHVIPIDNISIQNDFDERMVFKGSRTGAFLKFTIDVNPGYIYIEKFNGGIKWFMIEPVDYISSSFFQNAEHRSKIRFIQWARTYIPFVFNRSLCFQ